MFKYIKFKDEEDIKGNDPIGAIFGWYENQKSKGLLNRKIYPFVDGKDIDGFEFLNRLRKESEKELRMMAVNNCEYVISPFSVKSPDVHDIVRQYKDGSIGYWFEFTIENKKMVIDRLGAVMIEVMAMAKVEVNNDDVIENQDDLVVDVKNNKVKSYIMVPVTLWFPCNENTKKMRLKLGSENIRVKGMEVNVSPTGRSVQEKKIIVSEWEPVLEDLSFANNVLKKIKSWNELAPLTNELGESLFTDSIVAVLLANCFFSKISVPAFNLLVIGSKRNQKTAAISFLTQIMMGGSVVSGTVSSGRGWLVSHKEGVAPSKLFSEKNSLMIDEALKFHSTERDKGIVVQMKVHFSNHMELIEHKDIEATSGNGIIKGRMMCSLVCVDNPDEYILPAIGKAYKMQSAAFRRWNFLRMERRKDIKIPYMTTHQAQNMMIKKFIMKFKSLDSIRALLHLSRRFCNEEKVNADPEWVEKLKETLCSEVDNYGLYPNFSFLRSIDEATRKLVLEEIKEHIDDDLTEAIQAAWLSAAAMRAWEVCSSIDKFKLVYDDVQRNIAEMIVRELLNGRLNILFPGIIIWCNEHQGVNRSSIFGDGRGKI